MRVLAGDVGGTNARLALVEIHGHSPRILFEERFSSRKAPGLAPIVHTFREMNAIDVDAACFGIACPVVNGECRASNLPWSVNARALAAEIGIPRTTIINDFDALGHGLRWLAPSDVKTLQSGEPVEHGTIALLGAGTGLGVGFLVWDGTSYRVLPSEGGHADFAPRTTAEWELAQTLFNAYGRVSYERVLSGPGLLNIYRHLAASGYATEDPMVRQEMESDDPAAVITHHALAGTNALCERVLDMFVGVLGAHTGNLALTAVATGGVFIGGGIAPQILAKLQGDAFLQALRDKGRLSALIRKIPVHVILSPNAALLGAAAVAARL